MREDELNPGEAVQRALVRRMSKQELARWKEESAPQVQELLACYRCALKLAEAAVYAAGEELALQHGANPVENIHPAVKSPELIAESILSEGSKLSSESLERNLQGLARLVVVCSFLSDLHRVSDRLSRQEGISLLGLEDWTSQAREDGYRGLHLDASVPVSLRGRKRQVKVRIILQTPAMELWVNSERRFRQQRDLFLPEQIRQELQECASLGIEWDQRMEQIRYNIEHRVITK